MTDNAELVEDVQPGVEADVDVDDGVDDDEWVGATLVSALPVIDRLETDSGIVVMVRSGAAHRIARLSPLGGEVLDAVGEVTTLGALEAEMLERLGPPPDGDLSAAVHDAVRGLTEAGLLSVSPVGFDVTQS